jgi:hypothetical protein
MTRARVLLLLLLPVLLLGSVPALAGDAPPARLLFWHIEDDRIIVSNVRFSRTDELRLRGRERIEDTAAANAVLVVATNQRFLGYSVYTASWQSVSRRPGESLDTFAAEGWAGHLVTSRRVLTFNGRNAHWSERAR